MTARRTTGRVRPPRSLTPRGRRTGQFADHSFSSPPVSTSLQTTPQDAEATCAIRWPMSKTDSEADQYPPKEAEQRLKAILRGAFSKPPTPLKAVPTRHGQKRRQVKPSRAKARVSE